VISYEIADHTLTEGPHAGRQAIIVEPKTQVFRFLDLPSELRAAIYDYVFPKGVEIQIIEKNKSGTTSRLKRQNGLKSANTREEATGGRKGGATLCTTLRWQRPSGLNLLRVSKQLFKETVSVAYGNGILICQDNYLKTFLGELGSMRKYVKNIRICAGIERWDRHAKLRRSLVCLSEVGAGLRSLTFDHELVCAEPMYHHSKPTDFADEDPTSMFATVLEAFVDWCVEYGLELDDILPRIRIRHQKCTYCNTGCHPAHCEFQTLLCQSSCGGPWMSIADSWR
jgi:hypothetical protein